MGRKKGGREPADSGRPRFVADMLVSTAVDSDPGVKDVLAEFGLPCDRCIVAYHETLAEGCHPLGLNVAEILERLNALPAR